MREVDVDWEVVGDTRDRLGESVLWHPRDAMLYWIDFYGPSYSALRSCHRCLAGVEASLG